MNKESISDIGKESIGKLLFKLAIPAIAAQLANLFYNIIDRIYIGHIPSIGTHALTGVGLTFPIIMITSAFSSLIGMGGAPRAAIKMGENKYNEAENILGNCFVTLIAISLILTLFLMIFKERLLLILGASAETLPYSLNFLNIYIWGTLFTQITLGLNPFISTQGFSKISMISVIIGGGVSVILDPIFIFILKMGVSGAALANVIAQFISVMWVLKFLTGNKTTLKIRKENMVIKKAVIIPVFLLGSSSFTIQSTDSLLNIVFNSSLQNYGGDIAVGSMTIMYSLMQVLTLPVLGMTQGAQPIISYNYGAVNNERIKKTFKLLIICALSFTTVYWTFVMVAPRFLASLFTNDTKLLESIIWSIRIYMSVAFFIGVQISCQQTFIALGQAKLSVILALLRKVILLIPLIYILPNFFSNKVFAVFLAEPISDFLAVTITIITFVIQFRKILSRNVTLIT